MRSANSAINTMARNTTSPNTAPLLRQNRRHRRADADVCPPCRTTPTASAGKTSPSAMRTPLASSKLPPLPSLHPDLRMQKGVGQVHQQIDPHHKDHAQQHGALHDLVLAVEDRRHGEPTQARDGKDGFSEHRSAEE